MLALTLIPLTAWTTTTVFLAMAVSWLYVVHRTRKSHVVPQPSLRYLTNFFGYLAIFGGLMSLPYLWLNSSPAAFSQAAAWGYVVGHIFCYIAFMYVALMVCALVPRLNNKIRLVTTVFLVADVVTTIVNAKTMIWGVQPVFDKVHNLTEFRTAPEVGIAIAVMGLLSFFPAAVLFAVSAFKSVGPRRLKSILLMVGFAFITVGGPMHDNARTSTFYALADIMTLAGILILGAGVGFRTESGLAEAPSIQSIKLAPSNTV